MLGVKWDQLPSNNSLDMQADDEPQYPYPVYDSSSSEFESILSSKEWVSDVNNEHL